MHLLIQIAFISDATSGWRLTQLLRLVCLLRKVTTLVLMGKISCVNERHVILSFIVLHRLRSRKIL